MEIFKETYCYLQEVMNWVLAGRKIEGEYLHITISPFYVCGTAGDQTDEFLPGRKD